MVCPRQLLRKVLADAVSAGFLPQFSQEFEWYNFAETPQTIHEKQFRSLQPLTPGMFGYSILRASQNSAYFHDLFDMLKKFGVPLEGLHTETGPGVYEAAILYSGALEAADRAVLFKAGVKEIAHRHGVTSIKVFGSFVRGEARPDSDLDLLIEAGPNTTPFFPGGG